MEKLKAIYLAGGCFWGLEAYMARIPGVYDAESGYANGKTDNPSYEDLVYRQSGHAETVRVLYDPEQVSLSTLLKYYFRVIDPTSLNRQGNDRGIQYRTGIYYTDADELPIIRKALDAVQKAVARPVVVEAEPLHQYFKAEEYHQDYLEKNPGGYCHIDLSLADEPLIDPADYPKPDESLLRQQLSPLAYSVTQESATERPFANGYWDHHEAGLYVDVVTGEPLFTSADKFDSSCGWPSFTKPLAKDVVTYQSDYTHGMDRTEVRSRSGDSHLGHVFKDGPKDAGGLRYCINSAAVRFVPLAQMEAEGYGALIPLIREK